MNDRCLFCDVPWEQGDIAMAVGHIDADMNASLAFLHRNCILANVLGDDEARRLIVRQRDG